MWIEKPGELTSDFWQRRDIGADHRCAAGECFEHGNAKTLPLAWKDEHCGVVVKSGETFRIDVLQVLDIVPAVQTRESGPRAEVGLSYND